MIASPPGNIKSKVEGSDGRLLKDYYDFVLLTIMAQKTTVYDAVCSAYCIVLYDGLYIGNSYRITRSSC
jgi:hypothetical protein